MAPIVYDTPIRWHWKQKDLGDGTGIDMLVYFLAMDTPKDVKKLKSLEVTWCWLNEVSEIGKPILDMAMGRVGRYPGKTFSPDGITWSGVFADTNAMDDDHWYYKLAEENKPKEFDFFRQPPAVIQLSSGEWDINPDCESLEHQQEGAHYWLKQIPGKSREWIRVYLESQYGTITTGRPVYPEYKDMVHCARVAILPARGLPLWLGFDYGLTPACVFGQLMPTGQLRIIDELCTDVGRTMGIRQFATDAVKPKLANEYKGMEIHVTGDPAGGQRAQADDTITCNTILESLGLKPDPPDTNNFTARRDAVSSFLTRTVRGDSSEPHLTPAFLLSPVCKMLRKGFLGKYFYERVHVTGEERYKDQPCKNEASHPADALQYLCQKCTTPTNSKRRNLPPAAPISYLY